MSNLKHSWTDVTSSFCLVFVFFLISLPVLRGAVYHLQYMARSTSLTERAGTARNKWHTGCTRGQINQHRTCSISHRALMDMGESEHLIMCPECSDESPDHNHKRKVQASGAARHNLAFNKFKTFRNSQRLSSEMWRRQDARICGKYWRCLLFKKIMIVTAAVHGKPHFTKDVKIK